MTHSSLLSPMLQGNSEAFPQRCLKCIVVYHYALLLDCLFLNPVQIITWILQRKAFGSTFVKIFCLSSKPFCFFFGEDRLDLSQRSTLKLWRWNARSFYCERRKANKGQIVEPRRSSESGTSKGAEQGCLLSERGKAIFGLIDMGPLPARIWGKEAKCWMVVCAFFPSNP